MSGSNDASSLAEEAALVALLRERPSNASWPQITDAIIECDSALRARASLRAGQDALFEDRAQADAIAVAEADVLTWRDAGLQFWPILSESYPARVRDIQEAPPFLFARGTAIADDIAVSVVGSREATDRGKQMAATVAGTLVGMDVSVVAGLAKGIDTAAHVAALENGGRTVAVIGTGINQSYPAENAALQQRIAEEGLLLSQFWPDAPPRPANFPMRNAIMSGYGVATIVVEAGEHSGARIQARMAVHHGRPVILTDLVMNATRWSKKLSAQPDVYVASSTQDIADLVTELINRPGTVRDALSQIAV